MKSNYQIGDWVNAPKLSCSPAQILSIIKGQGNFVELLLDCGSKYPLCKLDEVEPISLTKELLEHFGFREISSRKGYKFYVWNNTMKEPATKEEMSMRVEYIGCAEYWRVETFVGHPLAVWTENRVDNVLYLHELQQVMRITGIDKELIF